MSDVTEQNDPFLRKMALFNLDQGGPFRGKNPNINKSPDYTINEYRLKELKTT